MGLAKKLSGYRLFYQAGQPELDPWYPRREKKEPCFAHCIMTSVCVL